MNDKEIEILRILQQDIPVTARPFQQVAQQAGLSEKDVLDIVKTWRQSGTMRRMGTILRHRKAGFSANGMSVWAVPGNRIEQIGAIMISFPQVGHCYQRPSLPNWPYNMFAMIHAQSREEVVQVVESISKATGIGAYDILFTVHEFKKVSMKYFVDEIPADLYQEIEDNGKE
ncbi:MAG: Lrp/AsnC family transcriptional regulator [Actinobacteria bacterium]|nr:Lrp/AsnC family transcriptional regulator [Actinomycetota bacterium]